MERTVGIEEEFLLVRPNTARLVPAGEQVVRSASEHSHGQFELELKREQAELGTSPHRSIRELALDLAERRKELAEGARRHGVDLAALATSPLDERQSVTVSGRYGRMVEVYGRVARLQLTCGLHVHVGIASRSEGVAVLDRIRPWLPLLVALTASSPYYAGEDTGYASYRTMLWSQWPTSGVAEPFGSVAAYDNTRAALKRSGSALDDAMIYFDARLSERYPTVEIRVADVCPHLEDAITVAALIRALVNTDVSLPTVRGEVLRSAKWRAARWGMSGTLLDPTRGTLADAWTCVDRLLRHARPALRTSGDLAVVEKGLAAIRHRGTGAELQRRVFARTGDLAAVVGAVVDVTSPCGRGARGSGAAP